MQRFSSVWDAIEDTPQQAASMRVRSDLMLNLTEVIRERGMTQGRCALEIVLSGLGQHQQEMDDAAQRLEGGIDPVYYPV